MRHAKTPVLEREGTGQAESKCRHHWVIDLPSGPVSRGVCKICGEQREFKNYLENTPYWEDNLSLSHASAGARLRVDGLAEDDEGEPTE